MAKDWEYAQVTKWIAEHGGPQKGLEGVKNYYMKQGFSKGAASKNPVIILVGVSCLVAGAVGKSVYDGFTERRSLKAKNDAMELAHVKKAEEELEAAMKQDAAGEIKTEDSPSPQAEDTISD